MDEPQKPFACTVAECGMTFTNEDHLHVHSKKHDMVLQLGMEQKAAFVADQTPTPTRFIRNCEEVGLFQDLQHVAENPFDEGFKKAMETKQGILCLENAIAASASDDVLHTPQMVYPLDSGDSTLFTSQRNITISRSSSDESGNPKECERTVSTVSRYSRTVNNKDVLNKIISGDTTAVKNKDIIETSLVNETIYSKNVIKTVIKDATKMVAAKDVLLTNVNKLQVPEKQQIMSQKSLDFVVDSLTSEINDSHIQDGVVNQHQHVQNVERKYMFVNENINKVMGSPSGIKVTHVMPKITNKLLPKPSIVKETVPGYYKSLPKLKPKPLESPSYDPDDIEVLIKLPNGKRVKMKAVEDISEPNKKQIIRNNLIKKGESKIAHTHPNQTPSKYELLTNATNKKANNPVIIQGPASLSKTQVISVPRLPILLPKVTLTATVTNATAKIVTSTSNIAANNPDKPIIVTSERVIVPAQTNTTTVVLSNEKITHSSGKPLKTDKDINDREQVSSSQDLAGNASNTEGKGSTIEIETAKTEPEHKTGKVKRSKAELESRSAASKRYRDRMKQQISDQQAQIQNLVHANRRLAAETAELKRMLINHIKKCPDPEQLNTTTFFTFQQR